MRTDDRTLIRHTKNDLLRVTDGGGRRFISCESLETWHADYILKHKARVRALQAALDEGDVSGPPEPLDLATFKVELHTVRAG